MRARHRRDNIGDGQNTSRHRLLRTTFSMPCVCMKEIEVEDKHDWPVTAVPEKKK